MPNVVEIESTRLARPSRVLHNGDLCIAVGGPLGTFVPQLTITKWPRPYRTYVSLRLLHDEPGMASVDQRALVWTTPSLEVRFYALGIRDGGHEMAVHLPRRPLSNRLRFGFETNADVFEQPAYANRLPDGSTRERSPMGGWRTRPVWVNNSFAFYGRGLQGDYRLCGGPNFGAGKIGHLHRSWAMDATGRRAWCHQTIEGGVLSIDVPWAFLNTAIYPVMVDPTFGYTTAGGSDDNESSYCILFKATSTPSAGTLDSITVRGRQRTTTAGVQKQNPALYTDNAGAPDARLAFVNTGGTAFTGSDSDILTAITYGSLVNGAQYWIGSKNDTGENAVLSDIFFKQDSNGGATELYYGGQASANVAGDWPASITGFSSAANERGTFYGTYTASSVLAVNRPRNMQRPAPFLPGAIRSPLG